LITRIGAIIGFSCASNELSREGMIRKQ
jgi:hypothetical protein